MRDDEKCFIELAVSKIDCSASNMQMSTQHRASLCTGDKGAVIILLHCFPVRAKSANLFPCPILLQWRSGRVPVTRKTLSPTNPGLDLGISRCSLKWLRD